MNNTHELDWRWLRSFVVVCESATMDAAARASGTSQPTLSRHVRLLEQQMGVSLFDRDGRSIVISQIGAELYERAKEVKASVSAFERHALGESVLLSGSVRVTMSEPFGIFFAPDWMAGFLSESPHISLDLVLDDAEVNLLLREAEIAVRLFPPTQLDLVTRRCGSTSLGFFASKGYLDQYGRPTDMENLYDHRVVGFDRSMTWINTSRKMGYDFARDDFALRTDSLYMHTRAAEAGVGIAVSPIWVGEQVGLERVFEHVTIPGQPIFLVAHPDIAKNPRIKIVWDSLSSVLSKKFS